MEFLFEALGQFLGELLLQLIGELLFELGMHALAEPFRRRPNPWLALLGYALFGAILGAASLLVFPRALVAMRWRAANVIVTPLLSGAMLGVVGFWRRRRGSDVPPLDRFVFGLVFALVFAMVRYYFAK